MSWITDVIKNIFQNLLQNPVLWRLCKNMLDKHLLMMDQVLDTAAIQNVGLKLEIFNYFWFVGS